MPIKPNLFYRPCAGIMLFNKQGQVLVGRRLDSYQNAWQLPQGGIDEGEEPKVAALRELKEEIGTCNAEIIGEIKNWLNYDLPPELLGKLWNGRFRGQTQKWFAILRQWQTQNLVRGSGLILTKLKKWQFHLNV